MRLDIYFKEDLANILASAEVASQATAWASEGENVEATGRSSLLRVYRQGYQAALMVVAQALSMPSCLSTDRRRS